MPVTTRTVACSSDRRSTSSVSSTTVLLGSVKIAPNPGSGVKPRAPSELSVLLPASRMMRSAAGFETTVEMTVSAH